MTEPNKFTKEEIETAQKIRGNWRKDINDPNYRDGFDDYLKDNLKPKDPYFDKYVEFTSYIFNVTANNGFNQIKGYKKFRELFPELNGTAGLDLAREKITRLKLGLDPIREWQMIFTAFEDAKKEIESRLEPPTGEK